jgi:diguanylate cyclase (GGDEF)-like protein/PAS domain S-box-containing protein
MLLIACNSAGNSSVMTIVRCIAGSLIAIGAAVVLGFALKFQYLFEAFYLQTGLIYMAFHTASGMLLLGAGLWRLSGTDLESTVSSEAELKAAKAYRTTITVVIVVVAATAIVGLAFMERASEREAIKSMAQIMEARRAYIEVNLDNRTQRAMVVGADASIRADVVGWLDNRGNQAAISTAEQRLQKAGLRLLNYGFSAVAVEAGQRRTTVAGQILLDSTFTVPLKNKNGVSLAWDKGYYLRTWLPMHNPNSGASDGYLYVEQTLPRLDRLIADANNWGETGVLVLCARLTMTHLHCFPQREKALPYEVPDHLNGTPLPMTGALAGDSGIINSIDYRGREVLAAFAPVSNTGLGLVVKMDISEVYAPVKQHLMTALPVILAMALLGLWFIRLRVKPLINDMASMNMAEKSARSRFVAAMESSPDAFLIYESIKNQNGEIIDFTVAYANSRVEAISGIPINNLVGHSILELSPTYAKEVAVYKKVANTQNILVEEFSQIGTQGDTCWLRRQAVPMLQGVAVTFTDITQEKTLHQALEESNRLRSAIVESAAYAIISTEIDGLIVSFNKAAERMLWYGADEMVGKVTPGVFHDAEEVKARAKALSEELGYYVAPGFDVFVAKAKLNHQEEHEWTYVRKDGSRFPVKLSVTALRDANNVLQGYLGIAYDISEQKRADEYIRHIALHDVLTGLPNRALLEDRVEVAIEQQRRKNVPFALVMLDIDRFKQVNDSMGHHIGDKLLKEFVKRVKDCIRPTDTIARMGGDEFVLVLSETEETGAEVVTKRILGSLAAPVDLGLQQLHITSSMGISVCPRDGDNINELMRCADVAMYWVKANGRNGFKMFSREMDRGATERMRLERDLHNAIEDKEFSLFYQPQIDLKSNKVFGVEALLRWRKADGQFVSPATFIPLAEDTGLIVPIGHWVLQTACRDMITVQEKLGRALKIAVNISPRQFVNGDLVSLVEKALLETNLKADDLELEITEGVLIDERSGVATALRELDAMGVSIAIDDFGTGYSSLGYLKRFPISKLKIDQSFVRDVITDPGDAALAVAIISMGHSLNIPVIAEGIETAEQQSFLAANNCDEGQGFYIGRPMPLDVLMQWLGNKESGIETRTI